MKGIKDTSGQDVLITPKNKGKKRLITGVVSLAVITALFMTVSPWISQWSKAEISVPFDRVRTAVVEKGDFVRDLSVQGRIVAAVSPKLYSPSEGTITFLVDAGDQVEQGAPLGTVESPELTNLLKQEESSLQSLKFELDRNKIQAKKQKLENQKIIDLATVSLNAADREKRRADEGYAKNAISKLDFEKAQDDLQNAKYSYQHAVSDAQLNTESLAFELRTKQLEVDRQTLLVADLSRQVEQLTILSPVAGMVGNLDVEQKSSVIKNQPILSVVDLSQYEVEVSIPESYADDLLIGMEAEVKVANSAFNGTLASISPEITENQVTGRVRFSGEVPAGLRQNQRLTTRILLDFKNDVLMVRRGQFLESGSGRVAYRINDGIAERVAIETGARSLSSVEVLSGLTPGDTIIISSTEQFKSAQNVMLTN